LQHPLAASFAADLVTGFQQPVLTALFKPDSCRFAPRGDSGTSPMSKALMDAAPDKAFPRGACIPDQKKKCAAFAVK
jgi:hypothetical protein